MIIIEYFISLVRRKFHGAPRQIPTKKLQERINVRVLCIFINTLDPIKLLKEVSLASY